MNAVELNTSVGLKVSALTSRELTPVVASWELELQVTEEDVKVEFTYSFCISIFCSFRCSAVLWLEC